MPWTAGVYVKGNNPGGWTGDQTNGFGIEAGRHDTQDDDFTAGINATLNKDGSNSATANLPMGGFKHTGVALAVASTDYARYDQVISQTQNSTTTWGGTSGGSANAQTLTLTPAITAYATGQRFRFIAGSSNTGATTLNINAVGAVSVVLDSTGAASSYYITATRAYEVLYDGTNFRLLNDPALIKRGDYEYLGQSTGTANALVLTSTGPRLTSTAIYRTFIFATNLANTGATTVAIDGLTAINILNPDTTALRAGQLQAPRFYQLMLISGSALLLDAHDIWQTYSTTGIITQGASTLTATYTESSYRVDRGSQVTYAFRYVITGATVGVAGQVLVLAVPVTAAWSASSSSVGSAQILDASTGLVYTCVAGLLNTALLQFVTGSGTTNGSWGAVPSIGLAINDVLSGTVTYRI